MLLYANLQLCHGQKINCIFQYEVAFFGLPSLYTCVVATTLENKNGSMVITGHTGYHKSSKTDSDVRFINIHSGNTITIPTDLGTLFNLTALAITHSRLMEIKSADFDGMENIEHLYLEHNNLTFIPIDAFCNLLKLKTVELMGNQITELENGIFIRNVHMSMVSILENRIHYIGSRLFHGFKNLKTVYANGNLCLTKTYNGTKEITELNRDIHFQCKKENEIEFLADLAIRLSQAYAKVSVNYEKSLKRIEELLVFEEENKILRERIAILEALNKFNVYCDFKDLYNEYVCKTHDIIIGHEHMKLDKIIGMHLDIRTNKDVTELIISNSHMKFLSSSFFKRFPNVVIVRILSAKLEYLKKGVFRFAKNVKLLVLEGNNINTLHHSTFNGMDQLKFLILNSNNIHNITLEAFHEIPLVEKLSLKNNAITDIISGTFSKLVNLKTLILSGNEIKYLDGRLLEFNTKLYSVSFAHNKITAIGKTLLDYAIKLRDVDFLKNWCIDGSTDNYELFKLIYIIKECCDGRKGSKHNYDCGHHSRKLNYLMI